MITLNDYRLPPKYMVGAPPSEFALNFQYQHENTSYLVSVDIDFENVPLITIYETDNEWVKYCGDSAENLYLVFNSMKITEAELIEYVSKWIIGRSSVIFN